MGLIMRRVERIIASSQVDLHRDMLTRGALESMVQQAKEHFLPAYLEHDYRNAPVGRTVDAYLKEGEDGTTYLIAVMEMFDKEDVGIDEKEKRTIVLPEYNINSLQVIYDRTYEEKNYLELVTQMQVAMDPYAKASEKLKKAFEPLSFLTIVGAFVLGAIASGFFNKIGSDGWDKLSKTLQSLIKKRTAEKKEFIITFEILVHTADGDRISCLIHYTNPREKDIPITLRGVLTQAEKELMAIINRRKNIARVSFDVKEGRVILNNVIGKSGIPLEITDILEYGKFTEGTNEF